LEVKLKKSITKSFILFMLFIFVLSFFSFAAGPGEEQVIRNLRAFSKLYGYVRFFHPADEAAAIDWEQFAIYGAGKIKNAADSSQLKAVLEELFLPLAPTLQIYFTGETPQAVELPKNKEGLQVVAWQHQGVWLGGDGELYQSTRLNRKNKRPTISPSIAGMIFQEIDAVPYRGQEIKVNAYVRAEVELLRAQGNLWLMVEKEEKNKKKPVFYLERRNFPIKSKKWASYEISGPVDKEAVALSFGCLLRGAGKVWADRFQVEVKDDSGQWQPISLQNPGFESGDSDAPLLPWKMKERDYYYDQTENLTYTFKVTTENPYEGKKCLLIESPYTYLEGKLFDKHPLPGEYVDKELDSGLYCRLPLALYSDAHGTLGKNPAYPFQPLAEAVDAVKGPFSGNDEAVRLADVAVAWNIFRHFYPYFDVVKVNWDQQLTIALKSAMADKDEKDFANTLQRMLVELQDGHASVSNPKYTRGKRLPLRLRWIENQVVVTGTKDPVLEKGDIILSIDDKSTAQLLQEKMEYRSGSTQWKRTGALFYMLFGPADSKVRLKIQRAGEILEIEAERNYVGGLFDPPEFDYAPIEKREDNIFYVNVGRTTFEEVKKHIDEIAEARGVIFDVRGYPRNSQILRWLLKEKDTTEWTFTPLIIYPDQENLVGYKKKGAELEPLEPHIKGKVVFLTDNRALSQAETFMSFVEYYKLGEIVGQPTGGTNGNVNPFELPGGYYCYWTGMKVLKQDGRQLHLIGVLPTVPLEPTIKDVAAGRDTLLEKALEIIRQHHSSKK
jgi:hypothetical protein